LKDGSVDPIGEETKHGKAWERVLVVAKGCQEIRVPVKSGVPARDTRINQLYAYNVRWTSKLSLLSLVTAMNNDVYQQQNNNDSCKIKLLKA
jgi:hypothetical protein